MTKKYSIALFLLLFACLNQCVYSQVWVRSYNGPANSDDKSSAMKIDALGNVYITGYSSGTGSGKDITTIKYNSAGVQQWVQRYNGPANSSDEAYAITIDASGNIYVTGYTTGSNSSKDIITIKYSNNGVLLWSVIHSSAGEYPDVAYAITVDAVGNTYICGYRYDHDYENEIVVIKYNSAGATQWTRSYNGTNNNDNDEAYAITVDGAGSIIVTGSSRGSNTNKDYVTIKYNASGVQQWAQRYNNSPVNENDEAYAITVDAANNIYITGYSTSAAKGKDYVTIKYNSSGVQQWLSRYNNSSADDDDIARAITTMNNGNVVVTGSSKSSQQTNKEDYLTIGYNASSGTEKFVTRYNDIAANSADIAYAIDVSQSNSSVFVTGSSMQSVSQGSEDMVTLEYTSTGNFRNKYRFANPGPDASKCIVVTGNSDFYIAGYLSGSSSGFNMSAAKFNDEQLTTISNTGSETPENYKLFQNYPNPFNPSTIIKFDVKEASVVRIAVYDALGRELLVPVNDFLKSGTYEVSLNMVNLSSGLYFYKMFTGSYTEAKTMMLIK